MKAWKHFKTITSHKILVMKGCFRVGLYKQGLLHDLSKYCPTEFAVGCRYYQGNRSPNNAEREVLGYSAAWLHHKGRNKHHYEYWIDYAADGCKQMQGMRMPNKYIVEMFIDRISASKTYMKESYTEDCPLKYYQRGIGFYVMHKDVEILLVELLEMLAKDGEEKTYQYIKDFVLK